MSRCRFFFVCCCGVWCLFILVMTVVRFLELYGWFIVFGVAAFTLFVPRSQYPSYSFKGFIEAFGWYIIFGVAASLVFSPRPWLPLRPLHQFLESYGWCIVFGITASAFIYNRYISPVVNEYFEYKRLKKQEEFDSMVAEKYGAQMKRAREKLQEQRLAMTAIKEIEEPKLAVRNTSFMERKGGAVNVERKEEEKGKKVIAAKNEEGRKPELPGTLLGEANEKLQEERRAEAARKKELEREEIRKKVIAAKDEEDQAEGRLGGANDVELFVRNAINSNKIVIFSKTYCPFCKKKELEREEIRKKVIAAKDEEDQAEGRLAGANDVELFVRNAISSNKIVIFSKTYCPFCEEAKAALSKYQPSYVAIELDEHERGIVIQDVLYKISGISTVPQVFVDGEFLM
uniref:Glutaredoxin domain-containing protein n=1 Tax=Steinernema glaseri TaxID=37863 RepID=A0A1I7Z1R0_9BILA